MLKRERNECLSATDVLNAGLGGAEALGLFNELRESLVHRSNTPQRSLQVPSEGNPLRWTEARLSPSRVGEKRINREFGDEGRSSN
jgi:hypothetical protein